MKAMLGFVVALAAAGLVSSGCASAPQDKVEADSMHARADAAFIEMKGKDRGLENVLRNAYGYVIFPSVGKGALGVGGAHGRGEVYEQGKFVGWADLTQATIGLQAGGQEFAELIVFENKEAMNRFKYGKTKPLANASAVALKAGTATSAKYSDGVIVFTHPLGGLMFEASVGGQEFGFTPTDSTNVPPPMGVTTQPSGT